MFSPTPARSRALAIGPAGLRLVRIGLDRLQEFTSAVYNVYSREYAAQHSWAGANEELVAMREEDEALARQSCFLAIETASGRILCTTRISRWTPELRFPIETDFGWPVERIAAGLPCPPPEVWHGGRLVSDKVALATQGLPRSVSLALFRAVNAAAFRWIEPHPESILLSELDAMALKAYRRIGYNWRELGPAVFYLGSPTVPVFLYGRDVSTGALASPEFTFIDPTSESRAERAATSAPRLESAIAV